MITQKTISQKLGVTPVLVSRALGGHTSVALATRERVEAAAKELGYDATRNITHAHDGGAASERKIAVRSGEYGRIRPYSLGKFIEFLPVLRTPVMMRLLLVKAATQEK